MGQGIEFEHCSVDSREPAEAPKLHNTRDLFYKDNTWQW